MKRIFSFLLISSTFILGSPSASGGFLDKVLPTKTDTEDGDAKMDLPAYKGLKHSVGVTDFKNEASWRGQWELGNNLGLMLESALFDSGRFVLVEREKLKNVVAEQDLMASGRMAKGKKVAQTGKLRGARYLATGAITEVSNNQSGKGGGLSFKGISVGGSGGKSHITAIIKIIDSTTGEIIAKKRVVGKAGKKGLRIGYSGGALGGLRGNLGGFNKTPLGEAAQDVIVAAVKFIAGEFEEMGFSGAVIKVTSKGQVLVNRGSNHGVALGQMFVVQEEGEELIDPDTGEILDVEEGEEIASIEVVKVREKISYCTIVDGEEPEKGAMVLAK